MIQEGTTQYADTLLLNTDFTIAVMANVACMYSAQIYKECRNLPLLRVSFTRFYLPGTTIVLSWPRIVYYIYSG